MTISLEINTVREDTEILRNQIFNTLITSFGEALKKCIDRNINVICIYLAILFGSTTRGHANLLIYRPFERTIERFEPHGQKYGNSIKDNSSINNQLKELFEIKLNKYTNGEVIFIPPNEICPYAKGFQILEGELQGLRIEGGGFCGMWSLFVMEMILNNPTKSTLQIIEKIMNITQQKPGYLKDIIRGYVIATEKMLDKTAKFLKKDGFSFLTEKTKRNRTLDLNDELIQEFILGIVFETEKEQREKKEFKILPEEKTKQKKKF